MIRAIVNGISAVVQWFFSERRAKAKEREERRKVADEVASGDEDKVNARITKLMVFMVLSLAFVGGCVIERAVYVREGDKAIALKVGEAHTNTSESVEWILPRGVMTKLLNAAEAK